LIADAHVQVVHICVPNYCTLSWSQMPSPQASTLFAKSACHTSEDAARLVDLAARPAHGAVPFAYRTSDGPEARDEFCEARSQHSARAGSYLQDWLFSRTRVAGESMIGSPVARALLLTSAHICATCWSGSLGSASVHDRRTRHGNADAADWSFHTFEAAARSRTNSISRGHEVDVHTEDLACVMFRMSEGALGTLTVSQVSAGRKNAMRRPVDGSAASLVFDGTTPDRLWFGRLDVNSEIFGTCLSCAFAERLNILPAGAHARLPRQFHRALHGRLFGN